MKLLRGAVRPYAWGSRTVLADLLGNPVPAPHPEAELWLGAHPGDPSTVDGVSLLEVLAQDPDGELGADVARRWDTKLPFLLKVLAAEEPLSLQAHPSAEQAQEGYAREEAAGIGRDAPERNYPDPTAKPELLCALSEFHALAGFRCPARSIELLRAIESEPLRPYTDLLAAQPDADGLRALFTTWVTLPSTALQVLLPAVVDSCVAHVAERGQFDLECRTFLELTEAYPGDVGALAALLLNRLVLRPGEAIHLPAGNVHAYLRGTGIEILANSDNVLRCGLTPKHVDVPELLRVVDFHAGDMPVFKAEQVDDCVSVYRAGVAEFELSRIDVTTTTSAELHAHGPQILICVEGAAVANSHSTTFALPRGASIWVPAADEYVRVSVADGHTEAVLYRATIGDSSGSSPQVDSPHERT